MSEANDQFDWGALVPHVLHPLKVAIIEAMLWIELPLSAKELDRVFDEGAGLSLISYHVRTLAKMDVIEIVEERPVRGALQRLYELKTEEPMSSTAHRE